MAELPKIDSAGLRLAKEIGAARVSSVVSVSGPSKDADVARIKKQRDIAQNRADYLLRVIEDSIEALERNSTAAPVLEILKAAVPVEH